MLEAIEHMHKCLYVHRDVKLENFRITKEGHVKLIDFGISFDYMKDGAHRDFGRYGFQGTPAFASINALDGCT